jgi:hypothetical protein
VGSTQAADKRKQQQFVFGFAVTLFDFFFGGCEKNESEKSFLNLKKQDPRFQAT